MATATSTGNKATNNQEGVFPDDTSDALDNPRVEYLSSTCTARRGKALGVVTTSDVFDATPAGNAVHTANRGTGTGIVDQFLDDRSVTRPHRVLMGGGRKWFLPAGDARARSARDGTVDYAFSRDRRRTPRSCVRGRRPSGAKLIRRDLIARLPGRRLRLRADKTATRGRRRAVRPTLLGLFAFSNMNVRPGQDRRPPARERTGTVVDDFGFPDQPMLDEMANGRAQVLRKQSNGFVLMVEGASIDKQAHNMDTERAGFSTPSSSTVRLDRAVRQALAEKNPDTWSS